MHHLPTFRDDGWALEPFRAKAARLGRRVVVVVTLVVGGALLLALGGVWLAAAVVRMLAEGDR